MKTTIYAKLQTLERKWYVIDAEGQTLGKVAVKAADILRGKNKPIFVPHQEVGDFVIIINAGKIAVSGKKITDKIYYEHSGFPGGMRAESLGKVLAKHPGKPLEVAIKGMLPKGALGNQLFRNCKVYGGATHPHVSQQPETIKM
jgi:large subunit ribosomal protein L13